MADTKDLLVTIEAEQKIAELKRQLQELQSEQKELQKEEIKQLETESEIIKKQIELEKESFKLKIQNSKLSSDALEEEKKNFDASNKARNSQLTVLNLTIKKLKEQNDQLAKQKNENKELLKVYGGLVDVEKKRKVTLKELKDISSEITKEQARATFAAKFQEMGFAAVAAAAAIVKANIAFDSIAASVRRATFTTGELDQAIIDITKSNVSAAVTYEQSAAALIGLRDSFSETSKMSGAALTQLGSFAAQMEKLGISSSTTGRLLNLTTKAMGMSRDQAMRYQKELVVFAKANGISSKIITEGIDSTMPRLAAFGKEAPKIFKEVAFQAQNMGMAMGEVLDITERFTTFEGAAEFVGQFNAAMGRNALDTISVLRKATDDPAALIEDIRSQLTMSGQTFEKMSNQRKRFIADITGISLPQLSSMMKKTSSEMRQAARVEEEYNKIVEASVSVGEKFKALTASLVPIFTPLINAIGTIVGWMADFIQKHQTATQVIGGLILVLGSSLAIYKGLVTIARVVTTQFGFLTSALGLKTAATTTDTAAAAANTATTELNTAAKVASIAATEGQAAAQATGNAAMAAAAPAAAPAIPIILAFGAGMLLAGLGALALGGGIYLAVTATTSLIDVLVKAGDSALTAAGSFLLVSLGIAGLAYALFQLGLLGSAGAAVLLAVAAAATAFAVAYKLIQTSMSASADAIKSLDSINIEKFDKLKVIMKEMAGYMETIGDGAEKLSSVPILKATISPTSVSMPMTTPGGATAKATGDTTVSAAGSSGEPIKIEIKAPIKLDGITLGTWIYDQYLGWEKGKTPTESNKAVNQVKSNTNFGKQ